MRDDHIIRRARSQPSFAKTLVRFLKRGVFVSGELSCTGSRVLFLRDVLQYIPQEDCAGSEMRYAGRIPRQTRSRLCVIPLEAIKNPPTSRSMRPDEIWTKYRTRASFSLMRLLESSKVEYPRTGRYGLIASQINHLEA